MLEWATEYWYLCLAALVIGVAVAAWIWLRPARADDVPVREIDEQRPAAPLEPARPVIELAERVDFTATPAGPAPAPIPAPTAAAAPDAVIDTASAATAAPSLDRPAVPTAVGEPDDLSRIKGLGPKLRTLLASFGITRFDQIAAWSDADVAEVDRFLGQFQGRIVRDNWVEQAGYLARGDTEGFAARFGALG